MVYSLTNEERNLKTEAVAYAQSLAEEPWVSALKHEGNYIVSRYFDAFAREFPGVRHFRVAATRTAMQLPESFAFRASFPDGAGSYFICIPPDVDVMDIDLKIGGETPRDIFITERADNCHLAVANSQPSVPQIVTANLPNIGPVKAFTSYSEGTRMGGNFPHLVGVRGGGFAGSNALLNDAGQYLYRGNNGFFTTNLNDISIDKSGRGVWVIHNPRKVTLSHSEVDEWPELPFLNQTRILSVSGQDRIYISGTTADGARCVALTTAGELTECESLNGVYLELADGRRCRTDGAQKVWCGDDETEGIQIPRDIIDTVPTAEGFYFSERNDVLSFFDANEHTIVEIGFLKLPRRLDENLFVSTFGTKIYRVEGSSKIEVFDIASLGEYNTPNAKIIVGRNTFLLGVTPFRYDPTK